jgi:hypothetical protein
MLLLQEVVQTLLAGQTHLSLRALITSITIGARLAQSQTTILQAMVQKRTAALAANQAQQVIQTALCTKLVKAAG